TYTTTTTSSTLSLHDALPILDGLRLRAPAMRARRRSAPGAGGQSGAQPKRRFRVSAIAASDLLRHWRVPPVVVRQLARGDRQRRSEEHTSELQSRENLVCRLL